MTVTCYVCGRTFAHTTGPAGETHGACPACLPGQYVQALQARSPGLGEVARRLAARFPDLSPQEIHRLVNSK
ncbi:MAG TPA: hypothetical protein VGD99_21910 [Anaerolineae bacterium]